MSKLNNFSQMLNTCLCFNYCHSWEGGNSSTLYLTLIDTFRIKVVDFKATFVAEKYYSKV